MVKARDKLIIIIFFAHLFTSTGLFSQELSTPPGISEQGEMVDTVILVGREFNGIELGMNYEEVDSMLQASSNFLYRGPADLSLNPSDQNNIIQTKGINFISEGIFQFDEEVLQVIVLIINDEKLSYFSLFDTLSQKYGSPQVLGPDEARWEDENTRISLEYPNTIKYLDMTYFNRQLAASNQLEAIEDFSRDLFLDSF